MRILKTSLTYLFLSMATTTMAQEAITIGRSHQITSIGFYSPKSYFINYYQRQSYTTSKGQLVPLKDWYTPKNLPFTIEGTSIIGDRTALLWGFSTGEYGEKYKIIPSIRLGIMRQFDINENTTLILGASRHFGGAIKEKTCRADYGEEVGNGLERVNCRLAASADTRKEALQKLGDDSPIYEITFKLFFTF